MNTWFLAAAAGSALICGLHINFGRIETSKALLEAPDLKTVPKFTAYYCWHLVSITLAGMALAFWIAAGDQGARPLAVFATFGSGSFAIWSLSMIAIFKLRVWHFPQWALFLPVAVLGLLGLYL